LDRKIRTLGFSAALLVLPFARELNGQGFGKFHKTITLQSKLPAVVTLPGNSFSVTVTASDAKNKPLTQRLRTVVETELTRYNPKLTVDSSKPDTRIVLNILNVDVPQPVPVTATTVPLNDGAKGTQTRMKPTGYKITGRFDAAYQAKTPSGRFVDASNINAKFAEQYNTPGTKVDEGMDAVKKSWTRIRHVGKSQGDEAEDQAPRSVEDVQQILMSKVTALIAARLVKTNETVEIPLARGKLDDANKFADAKQWGKMIEALETMQPLADEREDAYRFYNLAVAHEARGYSDDTPEAAKRDLEDAAADYGKAADMNPAEKRFVEAQTRIEIALAHYKKLTTPSLRKTS
jgi:hypothetical protein